MQHKEFIMKQSNLQFTDPHIERIDFRISENTINDNLPVEIEVKNEINSNQYEAKVSLNLTVGAVDDQKNVTTAFYFDAVISADFKWNEKISDIHKTLKISGGAVLLSYIRPVLANLTVQAGLSPLNLPFVDFTE